MSKTKTKIPVALTGAVRVGGNYLVVASDGTLRSVCGETKKGCEVEGFEVALNQRALKAVIKAAPLFQQLDKIQHKLELMEKTVGEAGDLDELCFSDENGIPAIRVGCTTVYPNELSGYLKQLGIKAS